MENKVNPRDILLELDRRTKAHSAGALLFFKKAGVPTAKSGKITLKDLQNLQISQPDIFVELLEFLYPENAQTAGAGFDWVTLVGGILSGAGGGLLSMGGNDVEKAALESERALAEQKAQSMRNTLFIVLGVLVLIVIAAVFIFKKGRK